MERAGDVMVATVPAVNAACVPRSKPFYCNGLDEITGIAEWEKTADAARGRGRSCRFVGVGRILAPRIKPSWGQTLGLTPGSDPGV
jgi:hypothetical protein